MSRDRAEFLGVPLDLLSMGETIRRCEELIEARTPAQHVVVNAGKIVLMQDDQNLRAVVKNCDLVSADGQSIVWAARVLGIRVPERVAGIDLMEQLLAAAEPKRWSVFLLGARQETLEKFEQEVVRRFPRLIIAGRHHGYFEDDRSVADLVAKSGARLLLVGISSPRKEYFLAAQLQRLGPVLAMGVGGSFDVWAGKTRRAPRWMQRVGLEWLHRLLLEPRRMWRRYLIGNARFLALVARETRNRAFRRRTTTG